MSAVVRRRPKVRLDLIEIFAYLATRADLPTARRFLREAEMSFEQLATQPGMGALYESDDPRFAEVHIASVSRFKSYLFLYETFDGGIEILRVLHGARDIDGILLEELGET